MRAIKVLLALFLLAAAPVAAAAQSAPNQGRLRVVVSDPSKAVIPGALVSLWGAENHNKSVVRTDAPTDTEGVATFEGLPPGKYNVQVMFEGFETIGVLGLQLKAGESFRREVELPIKRQEESVSVGRDAATNASDPKNGRFDTTLTKDQIAALPDDPDEMAAVLEEMAGPGATIRVDGFRGGRLPPKEQIRSIRISRDPFAAENHGSGMVHIDIVTQPGIGPMRGGMNFNFADDALNARTATQPTKGDMRNQMVGFNLSGTIIPQKTSFSLSANASDRYNGAEINARTLEGPVQTTFRQPSKSYSFNGRIDYAVSKAHTVRANLMANTMEGSGGVGGFNLQQQGIENEMQGATLRLSDTGPWGKSWLNETRLQVSFNSSESRAQFEGQTIRVLDEFTAGGAQTRGGRDTTSLEFASNLDYAKGKHSIRVGFLLEGQWVTSDQQNNYLGTFTFASLADYAANRPLQYSIRTGNPLIDYSQTQLGLFVQDDWRARPNLTVSFGVRQEMQQNLDDKLNLSPRFGLTWSPFKHGKTTVRGSLGVFNDWLEANVYEQVLQVDGLRQAETINRNPGYPDPTTGGTLQQQLPPGKYVFGSDLSMPWSTRASLGVQHQLTQQFGGGVLYSYMRGYDRFRGVNINAPDPSLGGVRPDSQFGNITQVESTGGLISHSVNVNAFYTIPAKRTFMSFNYMMNAVENDSNGAFSLPANSYDLAAEWGPAAGISKHSVGGNVSTMLFGKVNVNVNANWRSGVPYNITTGRDDNGDSLFLDRPVGVGRNSARGDSIFSMGGMFSYSIGFGRRGGEGGAGGTTVIMRDGVSPLASAGGQQVVMMGGAPMGAGGTRYSVNIFLQASNLLNTVNWQGYSGVMTSSNFGKPTSAQGARSVNMGVRFGF